MKHLEANALFIKEYEQYENTHTGSGTTASVGSHQIVIIIVIIVIHLLSLSSITSLDQIIMILSLDLHCIEIYIIYIF